MSTFVDTSALLATLDADNEDHAKARTAWKDLISSGEHLVLTSYILVEAFALVQHRLGIAAARVLQEDILPLLTIEWVDEHAHMAGVTAVLTASRKKLSLVDCVSFETMRRLGIKKAFTLDRHFRDQGFRCSP